MSLILNKCNLSHLNKKSSIICSACYMGKIHKLPFHHSTTSYMTPLELIHLYLWGPASIPLSNGYKYYIHFIDAYSRFTWIYMVKQKSEALQAFLNFKAQMELQLSHKIKVVQTDWEGEYQAFTHYLLSNGIIHRTSYLYTHEQNSIAESKHQHIVEHGLTLLAQTSLSLKYWDEAFRTCVFLNNRLSTSVLKNKSPLEVLFHTTPSYSQLKVFGYACYPFFQ